MKAETISTFFFKHEILQVKLATCNHIRRPMYVAATLSTQFLLSTCIY